MFSLGTAATKPTTFKISYSLLFAFCKLQDRASRSYDIVTVLDIGNSHRILSVPAESILFDVITLSATRRLGKAMHGPAAIIYNTSRRIDTFVLERMSSVFN